LHARPLQRRPGPPCGFVGANRITKLTGLFGQRCTRVFAAAFYGGQDFEAPVSRVRESMAGA